MDDKRTTELVASHVTPRPLTRLTGRQRAVLEQRFRQQSFLSQQERQQLAEQLQLGSKKIRLWFQNRR